MSCVDDWCPRRPLTKACALTSRSVVGGYVFDHSTLACESCRVIGPIPRANRPPSHEPLMALRPQRVRLSELFRRMTWM
jgi:hypothetical protein